MKLSYQVRSHVGLVRSRNEDRHAVGGGQSDTHPGSLFVVSDGWGLRNAGEVAAQLAVSTIIEVYYASEDLDRGMALVGAFRAANQRVYQQVKQLAIATATAALFIEGKLYVAHVGDSRAYRIHDRQLRQITEDHLYSNALIRQGYVTREDLRKHPYTERLLRAFGQSNDLEVDVFEEVLQQEDAMLLCTDGIHGYMGDEEIEDVLRANSLEDVTDQLIGLANARGGRDNATAILIWCSK